MSEKNKLSVPRGFNEVTPEWLTEALQGAFPGARVASAQVDKTMGFKPNKARVHLTYGGGGRDLPATLVIKGTFNGTESRGAIIDLANWAEVISYRDIAPAMKMNVPKVHHLGIESKPSESVVLLMEDLAARNPKYFHSGYNTLSYQEAALFLDAMASYNAHTWNSPKFQSGGEWGPGTAADIIHQRIHKEYFELLPHSAHWEQSTNSPRGAAVPRILRDPARMAAGWKRMEEVLASQARVMVHGDEHLGNYFVEGNGKAGFVDMLSRGERWPLHYTIFLIASLDSLDRRLWERPLLAHYLSRLSAYGVTPPSFEEAWYMYRCATICPLIIWYNNSSTWQPEATNTANAAKAGLAVLDHDAFGLVGL